MSRTDDALRRALDVFGALVCLLLIGPFLLVIALLVRVTSPGPALFVQRRVGREGREFELLKFRTMRVDAAPGPQITVAGDARVTRFGTVLRGTKLDELPQVWNVLRGDMSLVGPRPEVPAYVAGMSDGQRLVLRVRPGITDPASLAFRDEETLLAGETDPERAYREDILPRKIALSAEYLDRRTIRSDLVVIARTLWHVLGRLRPARQTSDPGTHGSMEPEAAGVLHGRVLSGVKWTAVAFYSDSLLRLLISVALARLLSPGDFGLIALATSLVGILALVQESGMSAALVQHRGALDPAATAALYMTFFGGVVLALGTWLAAPWVAAFVGQPALQEVLVPLSLLFLLQGLAHAPKAVLQREMSFRAMAGVRLGSTLVYGTSATMLAFAGYGVWSLVAANLLAEATLTGGSWLMCPWRPRSARFDFAVARELATFGRQILGANVLSVLRERLPVLLIGKLLGADPVGLFWMAQRWAALPVEGVTYVVSGVSYPAFARLRHDRDRFASGFTLTLRIVLLFAVPAAVGLALVSTPLVATLYDQRWQGASTLLAILAFYGLFHALAATTGGVFKASGAPHLVLRYAVVYVVSLAVLALVLGPWLGLVGVALAVTGSALVVALLALGAAARLLSIPLTELVVLASLPLQGVGALTLVVLAVDWATARAGWPAWAQLGVEAALGALAYGGVVLARRPQWFGQLRALRAGAPPGVAQEEAA